MYLVGAPHPHKADAQRLLEKLITDRQSLVTDAEVLQDVPSTRDPAVSEMKVLRATLDSAPRSLPAAIQALPRLA